MNSTEWNNRNTYNSFNSAKGLSYYDNYRKILAWTKRETDYLPPPIEVNLDPFAECNNRCYFCVGQRYLRNDRDEMGEMRKLPFGYMTRLVEFLATWGVRGLCISGGGEPSLHPDIWKLIQTAKKTGMDVAFVSNMVKLSGDLLFSLLDCRWVAMSVNAGSPETYRKVMGADHFEKVILHINQLAMQREELGSNVDLCFKMLVLPENQQEIYEACKLAKELGVQDFHARPVDFERSDINGSKPLEIDTELVKTLFDLCHSELEDENFHVYTVTHKFDTNFHVHHDFTNCLATPLVLPILTDGNAYLCVDRKMEKDWKIGSAYPDPEQILTWWGSEKHRQLIESVDIAKCSRCTWSQYNRQIEEVILADRMCLSFP